METEHAETVVEKAVAYVKDVLGIAPDTAPELTVEDAMRLDPNAYTLKSVAEVYLESAPRADGPKEKRSPAELHADGPMN